MKGRPRRDVCAAYFCTDVPTRKVISLFVPPAKMPLIRLPFFSFKDGPRKRRRQAQCNHP